MDCKRVTETVFLFFDNEMAEEERAPFEQHVNGCPDCARRFHYTRKLLLIVRQRCARCQAPAHLYQRILISLPHRRARQRELH
jgi:mycothiol system anti-sigma-R factor